MSDSTALLCNGTSGLRFGRFLQHFLHTTAVKDEFKIPPNLTERVFRRMWEETTPGGEFRGHRANTEAASNSSIFSEEPNDARYEPREEQHTSNS
jgi:hypothetical protein